MLRSAIEYHQAPGYQGVVAAIRNVPVDLSEQGLLAAARAETGLDDFGSDGFLPNLGALLDSLKHDAALNEYGRYAAMMAIVGYLKNRLRAEAFFKRHPEILARKITAPVVIIGPFRSGTTHLQRLLAADPRLLHYKFWELHNPAPRSEWDGRGRDPRIAEAEQAATGFAALNPEYAKIHHLDAMEAEEEIILLGHSFFGIGFELYWRTPSFGQWCLESDQDDAYAYMVKLMKLISWHRGDNPNKPLVLKSPQHLFNLRNLMRVLPDARLVFTHRDPVKTVASICSLHWNYCLLTTEKLSREWIGQEWMRKTAIQFERVIADRASISPAQQLDAQYRDLNKDWKREVRRVLDFAGMPFTAESEQAMQTYLARSNEAPAHGGHKYRLADFGLERERVRNQFADYCARYGIAEEAQ